MYEWSHQTLKDWERRRASVLNRRLSWSASWYRCSLSNMCLHRSLRSSARHPILFLGTALCGSSCVASFFKVLDGDSLPSDIWPLKCLYMGSEGQDVLQGGRVPISNTLNLERKWGKRSKTVRKVICTLSNWCKTLNMRTPTYNVWMAKLKYCLMFSFINSLQRKALVFTERERKNRLVLYSTRGAHESDCLKGRRYISGSVS